MIKVGLICNTRAAFPLMQWIHEQGCLAGVGILAQQSEFSEDIFMMSSQLGIAVQTMEGRTITRQLVDWRALINADIVLVLGFPYRIRKQALDSASLGYFNIHFGKLPEFGGSFPIFWQIVNGEKQGFLTIHKMDESLDSGPIAVDIPFEIAPGQTFGMVEANYSFVAVNGVFQLLGGILNNTLTLRNQGMITTDFYPKPTLKDLVIGWPDMSAEQVVQLVKAANPWNKGAIARINGLDIKIIEAKTGSGGVAVPGEVLGVSNDGWEVGCQNNTSVFVTIIYSSLGYLDGENMGTLGIKPGDKFDRLI